MTHHLSALSWTEVRHLDKEGAVVVLPIGATEQHGPHLPVHTDTLLAEAILERALQQLPQGHRVWRLPALAYGKSNEHTGFPGTFSLSAASLLAVVSDLARGVKAAGFERLVLLNSHGGNRAVLEGVARDLRLELGLYVFNFFTPALAPDPVATDPLERASDLHAGDWETSLMLAVAPQQVRTERATRQLLPWPAAGIVPGGGGATAAWVTADLSPQGHMGNAAAATVQKGELRLEAVVQALAQRLLEASTFGFEVSP